MSESPQGSEVAFLRAGKYEHAGEKLYFGRRHYFLALALSDFAKADPVFFIVIVYWVARHDFEQIRAAWLEFADKPEAVMEKTLNCPVQLSDGLSATIAQMIGDVQNSISTPQGDNEKGGEPKK